MSRAWPKVKTDWESRQVRDLAGEDMVRRTLAGGRGVRTQSTPPNTETAASMFGALMASGQIAMHRVDGWQTLDKAPVKQPIDRAA